MKNHDLILFLIHPSIHRPWWNRAIYIAPILLFLFYYTHNSQCISITFFFIYSRYVLENARVPPPSMIFFDSLIQIFLQYVLKTHSAEKLFVSRSPHFHIHSFSKTPSPMILLTPFFQRFTAFLPKNLAHGNIYMHIYLLRCRRNTQ
jgi:hypothetical protein